MMNAAILRGPYLCTWEMQAYEKLYSFGIQPTAIGCTDGFVDTSEITFPVKKLVRLGAFNKIPFLNKAVQFTTGLNNCILNLEGYLKNFDVVNSAETYNYFTLQSINSRKPTIVTVWENIPFFLERWPYKRIKRQVRERASGFIAITQKAKEALLKEGVEEDKITVIPAALNTRRFAPAKKDFSLLEQLSIPERAPLILFVGRFAYEKGVFELLASMKKIAESSNAHLLMVGSGTLKSELVKTVAQSDLSERVHFMNFSKYSKMPAIHNLADVFCLPSIPNKNWQEQFGYVLVEAMACGKPVVSTNTGSIGEVVLDGKTGLLVPPNDSASLSDALIDLLSDEKKRRLFGKRARSHILKNFDSEKIAEKISAVFKSAI